MTQRIEELRRAVGLLPLCEAEITEPLSRASRARKTPGNMKCMRKASYRLDGVCLCGQYAGSAAIKALLAAEHPIL